MSQGKIGASFVFSLASSSLEAPKQMLASSAAVFSSLPAAEEVTMEAMMKREYLSAAHEMMVKESVLVQLAETVDSCWLPFEGVVEMPALMHAQ